MARRGVSDRQIQASALQAGRRMVSRGQRPAYRVGVKDGVWTVIEAPWITVDAVKRREVVRAATGVIAAWLDCEPAAFDVEVMG